MKMFIYFSSFLLGFLYGALEKLILLTVQGEEKKYQARIAFWMHATGLESRTLDSWNFVKTGLQGKNTENARRLSMILTIMLIVCNVMCIIDIIFGRLRRASILKLPMTPMRVYIRIVALAITTSGYYAIYLLEIYEYPRYVHLLALFCIGFLFSVVICIDNVIFHEKDINTFLRNKSRRTKRLYAWIERQIAPSLIDIEKEKEKFERIELYGEPTKLYIAIECVIKIMYAFLYRVIKKTKKSA